MGTKVNYDYSELYKKGLSPAQVAAIAYVGERGSVFVAFNSYLHEGTKRSLLKRGFLKYVVSDTHRAELTLEGKKCYEIYKKIISPNSDNQVK